MGIPVTTVGPLHYQLSKKLQEEINFRKFKQGDLFTTEKSLMERFGVSSTTVRRALQDLVQKGYLYRRVGKGTFVRRPYFEESIGALSTFFEEMEARGLKPTSDILSVQIVDAEKSIAEKLQVKESESIYFIKKLLLADGEPIAILESYWPLYIGNFLVQYDLTTTGMFRIVENIMGIKLGEAEATIEAGSATASEAHLLGVQKGEPLLVMKRVVYSTDGKTVNTSRFAYRGDKYKYRARMIRNSEKLIQRDRDIILPIMHASNQINVHNG